MISNRTYSPYMNQIRLGVVRYFNALPLVEGLEAFAGLSMSAAVPSHIGAMLERSEIDIGLVSLIDFANAKVPLTMLPVGMIGCEGPTLTVRIFSKVPSDRIRTLAVDTDSHTSIALARIILSRVHGIEPVLVDFHARERFVSGDPDPWPEAVLLIGDKVVSSCPPSVRYPHQIDLGEAWLEMTGLPFVYAMWMCRAEDEQSPQVCEVACLLERQRLRNQARLDWLASTHAQKHHWPEDLAREYLGYRLRYGCGQREREGIARFFDEACAMGLAQETTPRYGCMHSGAVSI